MATIDPAFAALAFDACAQAALEAAVTAGATWADVRVLSTSERSVLLRDGAPESAATDTSIGVGVRVIADGAWGFAATSTVTAAAGADAARRAVALARATSPLVRRNVELAPEDVYRGTWVAPYDVDPVDVPEVDVVAWLAGLAGDLAAAPGVHHTTAEFSAARETCHYADTAGTTTTQQRVRCWPVLTAITVDDDGFEQLRTTALPQARGWEYTRDDCWTEQVTALPGLLAEKAAADGLPEGRYDLVIAPSNLWLTIHESVGHATEYDRAIGYEANYAGTSFATPDQWGTLRYGSDLMHITGDRTAVGGLATVAWDHEGVAAQSWDIVADGVLVGYQLDRAGATIAGVGRSNGCAYADSATHTPLQRMPNVSLQPAADGPDLDALVAGVTDGLLLIGDNSWSIDSQRRNFQFTAGRFHRIRAGRIVGQVRNIAYQSDTLDFWRSLVALGGEDTYELGGALNCGKGQPGQVAPVSHGCPAAVFEGVKVLPTRDSDGSP